MEYILASQSPRRKELLALILPSFSACPADVDESTAGHKEPGQLCMELARMKCLAVSKDNPDCCVIGSDTIVVAEGEILGKPTGHEDEMRMLRMLSGRTHSVLTGVHIEAPGISRSFFCTTLVHFASLSDEEMESYASSNDPYDKAGGYGIQSGAARFCTGIDGDYFNVMGLPVPRLYSELKQLGLLPRLDQ